MSLPLATSLWLVPALFGAVVRRVDAASWRNGLVVTSGVINVALAAWAAWAFDGPALVEDVALGPLRYHVAVDGLNLLFLPLVTILGLLMAVYGVEKGRHAGPGWHANVLWFVAWARERFAIGADDVLTGANPAYFDNSVFDFYAALFSGAALAPFSAAEVREPRRLVQLVNAAGCTSWFSVPSLLVYLLTTRALDAKSFAAVRRIVFGGEGFPKAKLKQLFDLFGARARLENVYGPTECTCICSAHTIDADDFADMRSLAPLGRLAENFDYEILPLDAGDADFGELFLRGPQVGLGYYADPVRTAQSFVQNPRHALYADIGYRTGDLVRRDARGWLHFAGRADFQVKHLGYRIELEEVEAALNALPGVRECGVVYQPLGDGLGQILAFAATAAPADPAELLAAMARLLPHYMMPRRLVLLDALPKNANGKIDRPALLAGAAAA